MESQKFHGMYNTLLISPVRLFRKEDGIKKDATYNTTQNLLIHNKSLWKSATMDVDSPNHLCWNGNTSQAFQFKFVVMYTSLLLKRSLFKWAG